MSKDNWKKYLKQIDMFGADYQFTIMEGQRYYKSAFGGGATLVLYIISVSYFLFMMSLFFLDAMLPTITTESEIVSYSKVSFQASPFRLNVLNTLNGTDDPFQLNDNILIPLLLTIKDVDITNIELLIPEASGSSRVSSSLIKDGFDLVHNVGTGGYQIQEQKLLLLSRCQEPILRLFNQSSQCASDERIEKYFQLNSSVILNLNVYLKQYIPSERRFKNVTKQTYLFFDKDLMVYSQILLKGTKVTINDGIIIPRENTMNVISDVSVITQTLTDGYFKNFAKKIELDSVMASYLFRLDPLQSKTYVQNAQLGEVLAQIGSIVQIIMLAGIGIKYLNGEWLKQFVNQEILGVYFPELKKAQFKWDNRGQLQRLTNSDGAYFFCQETKKNEILIKKLLEQSRRKQDLINIFVNLANIEIFVDLLLNVNQVDVPREMGFELPLEFQKSSKNTQNKSSSTKTFPEEQLECIEGLQPINPDPPSDSSKKKQAGPDSIDGQGQKFKLLPIQGFGKFDRFKFEFEDDAASVDEQNISQSFAI